LVKPAGVAQVDPGELEVKRGERDVQFSAIAGMTCVVVAEVAQPGKPVQGCDVELSNEAWTHTQLDAAAEATSRRIPLLR
jgi:hypothetical protein